MQSWSFVSSESQLNVKGTPSTFPTGPIPLPFNTYYCFLRSLDISYGPWNPILWRLLIRVSTMTGTQAFIPIATALIAAVLYPPFDNPLLL